MELETSARLSRRAWALAVISAFLFALGGVAARAQEFWVWISNRVASFLMVLGLLCSLISVIYAARVIFSRVVLTKRQQGLLLGSILLAALPPVAFLLWLAWLRLQ
jgi:hypothetical protein